MKISINLKTSDDIVYAMDNAESLSVEDFAYISRNYKQIIRDIKEEELACRIEGLGLRRGEEGVHRFVNVLTGSSAEIHYTCE